MTQDKVILHTPFLGSRNYVHSTCLYKSINDHYINDATSFISSLTIRKLTKRLLFSTRTELSNEANFCGVFNLRENEKNNLYYLYESDTPVKSREPFDESKITENAEIIDQSILLKHPIPFRNFEIIVALTKSLHYNQYPLLNGKWVFININFNQQIGSFTDVLFSIQIEKKLGKISTVSGIYANEKKIGTIRFGVHKS